MTKTGNKIILVISVIVMAVILTLFIVSLALAKRDSVMYPSNVIVGGVCVADLNKEEAYHSLEKNMESVWGNELKLILPDKSVNIPLNDLQIKYDYSSTLQKADNLIDDSSGITGTFRHVLIRGKSQLVMPVFSWDKEVIYQKLIEIQHNHDKKAVDARILHNNDFLEYIPHKMGYSINIKSSFDKIVTSLQNGSLGPIELIMTEISPRVKLEDIRAVKDILGVSAGQLEYTAAGEVISTVNNLNGLVLVPGDTFGINHKKGNNIVDNSLNKIDAIFWDACSQSGLSINKDTMQLSNNLQNPVLITAELEGTKIIIKIFGCQMETGKEIRIINEKEKILPEVHIQMDTNLSPGERSVKREGKNGVIIRKYRVVTSYGEEIEKELLSEEFYPGVDTIIQVGPGSINK